jgi:hypothetical protein
MDNDIAVIGNVNSTTKDKYDAGINMAINFFFGGIEGWNKGPTKFKKNGSIGIKLVDPKNTHNNIRIMPGNPNSPHPHQQRPYVIFKKSGVPYDVNGKSLKSADLPEAHIPQDKFDINKMPKFE